LREPVLKDPFIFEFRSHGPKFSRIAPASNSFPTAIH
jgi:hypothetical protein